MGVALAGGTTGWAGTRAGEGRGLTAGVPWAGPRMSLPVFESACEPASPRLPWSVPGWMVRLETRRQRRYGVQGGCTAENPTTGRKLFWVKPPNRSGVPRSPFPFCLGTTVAPCPLPGAGTGSLPATITLSPHSSVTTLDTSQGSAQDLTFPQAQDLTSHSPRPPSTEQSSLSCQLMEFPQPFSSVTTRIRGHFPSPPPSPSSTTSFSPP